MKRKKRTTPPGRHSSKEHRGRPKRGRTMKALEHLSARKLKAYNALKQISALIAVHYPHLRKATLPQILARLCPARHSSDFRSVRWYGRDFVFTPAQSLIVQALWNAWENNTPRMGAKALLRAADMISDKISDLFKEHPAWNEMILTDSKGNYWLLEG